MIDEIRIAIQNSGRENSPFSVKVGYSLQGIGA